MEVVIGIKRVSNRLLMINHCFFNMTQEAKLSDFQIFQSHQ